MSKQQLLEVDPDCLYCGKRILGAIRSQFHGKTTSYCKYTHCRNHYYSFKNKIEKLKQSDNPYLIMLAFKAERTVLINKNPAMWWDSEITLQRKCCAKGIQLPMIKT